MAERLIPLILTRPAGSNDALLGDLSELARRRIQPLESPLLSIVATGAGPDLSHADAVIFTSANGVKFAPEGQGIRAFCVGEATTERAIAAGWDAMMAGVDADELVATLSGLSGKLTLVHLCGRHRRGDVAGRLARAGHEVREAILYDQRKQSLTEDARRALSGSVPPVVPLFSPRTAEQFAKEAPEGARFIAVALSGAVAAALGSGTAEGVHIAAAPTRAEMVKLIEKIISGQAWVEGAGPHA